MLHGRLWKYCGVRSDVFNKEHIMRIYFLDFIAVIGHGHAISLEEGR
jgi:hypothetical protein